jgi:hypothetical protein
MNTLAEQRVWLTHSTFASLVGGRAVRAPANSQNI